MACGRSLEKPEWLDLYHRLAADPHRVLLCLRLLLIYGVLYLDLNGVRIIRRGNLLVTLQQRFLCKTRGALSVQPAFQMA